MVSTAENVSHIFYKLQISFFELWSSKKHANTFNNTRSTYLRSRITILCYVWAALTVAWSPADFMFLNDKVAAANLALLRLVLAFALIAIGFFTQKFNNLNSAKWSLFLVVASTNCFFFASSALLGFPSGTGTFAFSYALLPIIHIVMLTIFPLTMRESIALMSITLVVHVWVDSLSGILTSPENMSSYWLQTVIAFMVLWSQLSQLHMILRLYRQATLDPLTGIYNRRMLLQLAHRALTLTESKGKGFSVLLLDLDKFKRINDKWGHYAGDVVLKAFTREIQKHLRKSDIFGRFGGEEFIVFLPNCEKSHAADIAQRLIDLVRALEVEVDECIKPLKVTTSVGISSYIPGDSLSSLIERADNALYKAKSEGRDRLQVFEVNMAATDDYRARSLPELEALESV